MRRRVAEEMVEVGRLDGGRRTVLDAIEMVWVLTRRAGEALSLGKFV